MAAVNSFENYLSDIGSFGFLSQEEERTLIEKAQKGDRASRDRVVSSNLRYVVNVAKKFQDRGVDLEDLVCAGNIGLVKAVDKFDPSKGTRFITCADFWIKAEIRMEIGNGRRIHIPHNYEQLIPQIWALYQSRPRNMNHGSVIQWICDTLGIKRQILISIMNATGGFKSLDCAIDSEDDGRCLHDIVEDQWTQNPEESALENDACRKVSMILEGIPSVEKKVLRLRYGIGESKPMTYNEISLRLGLTREGIRQAEKRGKRRFAESENWRQVEDYCA
ncbi:MAG: sigma-70 family RNA polymerase sigma factor [Treponema sp.]|nr:sigma-70 family RNA polymerase sigma factor [Treponema sp.]